MKEKSPKNYDQPQATYIEASATSQWHSCTTCGQMVPYGHICNQSSPDDQERLPEKGLLNDYWKNVHRPLDERNPYND